MQEDIAGNKRILFACLTDSLNMNATVDILDKTQPDDPFVCSWVGELFAYISLSAKLNEDTVTGACSLYSLR